MVKLWDQGWASGKLIPRAHQGAEGKDLHSTAEYLVTVPHTPHRLFIAFLF